MRARCGRAGLGGGSSGSGESHLRLRETPRAAGPRAAPRVPPACGGLPAGPLTLQLLRAPSAGPGTGPGTGRGLWGRGRLGADQASKQDALQLQSRGVKRTLVLIQAPCERERQERGRDTERDRDRDGKRLGETQREVETGRGGWASLGGDQGLPEAGLPSQTPPVTCPARPPPSGCPSHRVSAAHSRAESRGAAPSSATCTWAPATTWDFFLAVTNSVVPILPLVHRFTRTIHRSQENVFTC